MNSAPDTTNAPDTHGPAHNIIIDATRAGVLLIADPNPGNNSGGTSGGASGGGGLRFKALRTLPADLAQRIKAHRVEVLALLTNPPPADPPRQRDHDHDTPAPQGHDLLADVMTVFPEAEVISTTTTTPPRPGATLPGATPTASPAPKTPSGNPSWT